MITTYVIGPDGRPTIQKSPNETLEYSWDFSDYLTPLTDTIASVVSITLASGLTAVGGPVVSGSSVTQKIAGGTLEKTLRATCLLTTAAGRIVERSIWLAIVQR